MIGVGSQRIGGRSFPLGLGGKNVTYNVSGFQPSLIRLPTSRRLFHCRSLILARFRSGRVWCPVYIRSVPP